MSESIRIVSPDDPAGKGNAYRTSRILIESGVGLHAVCWMVRALDGSLSFGFSHDFTVAGLGTGKVNEDSELVPVALSAISDVPHDHRIRPHVTLHSSGVCHIRTERHEPILQHLVPGWYPVKQAFYFIHAFTDPLREIPVVEKPRKRDAVVRRFIDTNLSAYIRVEILPSDPGAADHLGLNTEVVVLVGPDYCLRTAVYHHEPVSARLYVKGQ